MPATATHAFMHNNKHMQGSLQHARYVNNTFTYPSPLRILTVGASTTSVSSQCGWVCEPSTAGTKVPTEAGGIKLLGKKRRTLPWAPVRRKKTRLVIIIQGKKHFFFTHKKADCIASHMAKQQERQG